MEVENEVELAHIAEEMVQDLHEQVDGLQVDQLIVIEVDTEGEEESCVSAVDDLVCPELDQRAGQPASHSTTQEL